MKHTISTEQFYEACKSAGLCANEEALNKAIAIAAKQLADEIDDDIFREITGSVVAPKEHYEFIENPAEVWEKLKFLDCYDASSSMHISEERYELDGVKYICTWEIWGVSDIPNIAILKETT